MLILKALESKANAQSPGPQARMSYAQVQDTRLAVKASTTKMHAQCPKRSIARA